MEVAAKVSIITPVYHAVEYIKDALDSVVSQTHRPLELSVYIDGGRDCDDGSIEMLESYRELFAAAGIEFVLTVPSESLPGGCGYACNKAIAHSTGEFLCFLDADDNMTPDRIRKQLAVCCDETKWIREDKYTAEGGIVSDHDVHRKSIKGSAMGASKHVIVGCNVTRGDENATPRYTQWINALEGRQLLTQRYRECTLIKPTWFMSRDTFESVGSFDESGPGTPEDMIFLYKHLDNFGALAKVCEPLVMYRYHAQAQSHSVKWQDIFDLRVKHIEHHLLNRLSSFSVWSAGREGKRFYRALDPRNQTKVACFLDVKDTLIKGPGFRPSKTAVFIPIRHYTQLLVCGTDVIPRPVITCVKLNLHSGFETNMADVKLTEGYDCIYFA